jgi:hypothetical protein
MPLLAKSYRDVAVTHPEPRTTTEAFAATAAHPNP